VRQFNAARPLRVRLGREMIDHALDMGPGRKRRRQGVGGILLHRALQQFERARIAFGIEREHARHGPQGKVVRTEVGAGLAQRALDLGRAQTRLHRCGDPRGEMFRGGIVIM
jgi:hypothetical protein